MTARVSGLRAGAVAFVLSALLISGCRAPNLESFVEPPNVLLKSAQENEDAALRFAIIGDAGTGGSEQHEIAAQLIQARNIFPYEFVLMLGDNMYGRERPSDFVRKFERPYKPLLDAGVRFYAALGNHDEPKAQTGYELFNMRGERYYNFSPLPGVRFFALDSTSMNGEQTAWFERELAAHEDDWEIIFCHHPPYSSGARHGPDLELRAALEPLIVEHGVEVVFSGHEHFYERLKPQKGVQYFILGSSGKLRRGNIRATDLTAKGFDLDNAFMLAEIQGDEMRFEVVSRTGLTVDSGSFKRAAAAPDALSAPSVSD